MLRKPLQGSPFVYERSRLIGWPVAKEPGYKLGMETVTAIPAGKSTRALEEKIIV
jgi:hypothetical protein